MTLELCLFLGLIFHLIGDYVTQNNWLAQNKTKAHLPALIHALIYSLPFLFICQSWWWLLFISHFLIDRYRLAMYWIRIVNMKRSKKFQLMLNRKIFKRGDVIKSVDNVEGNDMTILSIEVKTEDGHTAIYIM